MKKFIIVLLVIPLITIASFLITKATTNQISVSSDNLNAQYTVTSNKQTTSFTNTNCFVDSSKTTLGGTEYSQQVNYFIQEQTENSKVVTWAINEGYNFRRSPIGAIAQDYERKHPGWKVTCGINADQYYQYEGSNGTANGSDYFYPQPYYPMICDGEAWFSITVTPYGAQNVAGFLQDGSADCIVSGSANWNGGAFKINGLFLNIYDQNGTFVTKYFVKNFNESPRELETTIWAPTNQMFFSTMVTEDISITGNAFLVSGGFAYTSNSIDYTYKSSNNNQNAFFGKGTVIKNETTVTASKGQFIIETKDPYLEELLKTGYQVVAQYEYEGILNEVEAAIGYHTVQRMNDQDIYSDATYNTQKYPRALFGRTVDGKIVLITVDGRQENKGMCGTSHDETNALLKYYGCVEAYQMDGGGSVTAIIRDENGAFKVTNSPSDGSPRQVLSALLFVEKEVTSNQKNSIDTNIMFYNEMFAQAILNIKRFNSKF